MDGFFFIAIIIVSIFIAYHVLTQRLATKQSYQHPKQWVKISTPSEADASAQLTPILYSHRTTETHNCPPPLPFHEVSRSGSYDVIIFHVKNLAFVGKGKPIVLELTLTDVTEGSVPVKCSISNLTKPGSGDFLYTQTINGIPDGSNFLLTEFKRLVSVPVFSLSFPNKGYRNIVARFNVIEDGVYTQATSLLLELNSAIEGGSSTKDSNPKYKTRELGLQLALSLAACDGRVHTSEMSITKNWAEKRILMRPEKLKILLEDSVRCLASTDVYDLTAAIDRTASLPEKYEILELCIDVMCADDFVEASELKYLIEIVDLLQLSKDKYLMLLDRRLALIPEARSTSTPDLMALFGIDASMPLQQVEKCLRKEYTKWNARTTSSDKCTKLRSKARIDVIVTLKERLKR